MSRPTNMSVTKRLIQPYNMTLLIVFSDDLVAAAKWYNVTNSEDLASSVGFACGFDNGVVLVAFDRKHASLGTLSHEAVHAAHGVFRRISSSEPPLSSDSSEPFAYLQQHIFEHCLAAARKQKIRLK